MNHVDNNLCPVCGYDGLEDGTASGELCSSCGTEFGYSDFQRTHAELRQRWINKEHARWWSRYTPMPDAWSPVNQLCNTGYECTVADLHKINPPKPVYVVIATNTFTIGIAHAYFSRVMPTHSDAVTLVALETGMSSERHFLNGTASSKELRVCLSS